MKKSINEDSYMDGILERIKVTLLLIALFLTIGILFKSLFFLFLSGFYSLIPVHCIWQYFRLKKILLDPNMKELLEKHVIFYSVGFIVTDQCIIDYFYPKRIILYDDVAWIYNENQGSPSNGLYMNIVLKNGKQYPFLIKESAKLVNKTKNDRIEDFQNIILEKNPNILVGKSRKIKKLVFEKYELIRKKYWRRKIISLIIFLIIMIVFLY